MPYMNPCRLYVHLAFTYSVGPSSVVWSKLGPAPPFSPMRVLEVYWSWALSLVCEVALISNCICSFTNTKCKPKIICHSLWNVFEHCKFTMLQLLSLTKWFSYPNFNHPWQYFKMEMFECKIYQTKSGGTEMDEQKISWDDGTCNVIHKMCH